METLTQRSLHFTAILFLFFLGKDGHCQTQQSIVQQGVNLDNFSPTNQLINTPYTVTKANGILPDLLSAPRPTFPFRENNLLPLQGTNANLYEIGNLGNLRPAINVNPLSILDSSYSSQPNIISTIRPNSFSNFPSPSILALGQNDYTTLQNEANIDLDYFNYSPNLNQFASNRCPSYGTDVNNFNEQTNIISVTSEVDNIANSIVNAPSVVPQLTDLNGRNQLNMPYSIEINLPILSLVPPNSGTPYVNPPQIPRDISGLPPIIVQGSSKSKMKKLLPILLISLLGSNGGSSCGCGSGNTIIPYPIPIPTNNPIITNGSSQSCEK